MGYNIAGGGGAGLASGDWTQLGQTVVASSQGTMTVSWTDAAYNFIMFTYTAKANTGSPSGNVRFNNDSGTTYLWRRGYHGATYGTATTSTTTLIYPTDILSTDFTTVFAIVNNTAAQKKTVTFIGAIADPAMYSSVGVWDNTVNRVNRIDVIIGSGLFDTNSILSVWGRKV